MMTPVRHLIKPVNSNDVPVTDAVDRLRMVSTYRRSDRIVLATPPGEAAVMHPDDARTLANKLYEHANAVDSRWPGRVLPFRRR